MPRQRGQQGYSPEGLPLQLLLLLWTAVQHRRGPPAPQTVEHHHQLREAQGALQGLVPWWEPEQPPARLLPWYRLGRVQANDRLSALPFLGLLPLVRELLPELHLHLAGR